MTWFSLAIIICTYNPCSIFHMIQCVICMVYIWPQLLITLYIYFMNYKCLSHQRNTNSQVGAGAHSILLMYHFSKWEDLSRSSSLNSNFKKKRYWSIISRSYFFCEGLEVPTPKIFLNRLLTCKKLQRKREHAKRFVPMSILCNQITCNYDQDRIKSIYLFLIKILTFQFFTVPNQGITTI